MIYNVLYSKVTYTHTHTHAFSHIILHMFHHKWLYIIPCAIQQDLIAYPISLHLITPISQSIYSQSIPLPPPPPWEPQVCSPSPWGSFLWKGSFMPYIRFTYGICLSLSDLLHLVWRSLAPSMLLQMALFCSFLWLGSIPVCVCARVCVCVCVCIPHLNPFICQWAFKLFPCLGYCEQCCSEHMRACIFLNESFVWVYAQEWDCWVIW